MSEIKVYRVPQYMSKRVNVICVDGVPVCTVRGKKTTGDIIAKLSGYDVEIKDGRIDKLKGENLKCNMEYFILQGEKK